MYKALVDGIAPSTEPLLLHFDINKTVLMSDAVQMSGVEQGMREGIAELFWGEMVSQEGGTSKWVWNQRTPSSAPDLTKENSNLMTYSQWCKKSVKKAELKDALRYWGPISEEPVYKEMMHMLDETLKQMQLPEDLVGSEELREVGITGDHYRMFPALFHLVAALQKSGRHFALVFRSFGNDHESIKREWNAFCDLRHPLYSYLIVDVGPMNGTKPGVPDRRIHTLNTLYIDKTGPTLLLDTFTNGPASRPWDAWIKSKPKPAVDYRNGHEFMRQTGCATVRGTAAVRQWMTNVLLQQASSAIKDDWAWWQFHNEEALGGKLFTEFCPSEGLHQVFFDDNIELKDPRIVCVQTFDGNIPDHATFLRYSLIKVNCVEAVLDENYFMKLLYDSDMKKAAALQEHSAEISTMISALDRS